MSGPRCLNCSRVLPLMGRTLSPLGRKGYQGRSPWLVRAPLNLSASCECRPTRPDGGGGVTGSERTGGDLGGPRETDCVPGHIGFELPNPSSRYVIEFA